MTSQLRKINNVIEQFLLPLAEAVSGWSTLAAIRSALIVTLPLMFLGSLAELAGHRVTQGIVERIVPKKKARS